MNIAIYFIGDSDGNYVPFSKLRELGVVIDEGIDEEQHKKMCCIACKIGNMDGNTCKVYAESSYDSGLVDYRIVVHAPENEETVLIERMINRRFPVDDEIEPIHAYRSDDNCDRGFCGVTL